MRQSLHLGIDRTAWSQGGLPLEIRKAKKTLRIVTESNKVGSAETHFICCQLLFHLLDLVWGG